MQRYEEIILKLKARLNQCHTKSLAFGYMTGSKLLKITCNGIHIKNSPEVLYIYIVGKSNLENVSATAGWIYFLFLLPGVIFLYRHFFFNSLFLLFDRIIPSSLNVLLMYLELTMMLALALSSLILVLNVTSSLVDNFLDDIEKSDYEVWRFEVNTLKIFRFKAPRKKLKSSQINTYLNNQTLIEILPLSKIIRVGGGRTCNEGGCYYCFSLHTVNFLRFMYTNGQTSFLLEKNINDWLTR